MSTEHPHPYHESLTLKNFTAFEEASFEFVPGINVFIGENGTGKTHVMKVLYGINLDAAQIRSGSSLQDFISTCFNFSQQRDLIRVGGGSRFAEIKSDFGGVDISWSQAEDNSGRMSGVQEKKIEVLPRPVFIPSLDMIGYSQGFSAMYERFQVGFDRTHNDLVVWLQAPVLRETEAKNGVMYQPLRYVTTDSLELFEGRFFFVKDGTMLPANLYAEGLRKFATLQRLFDVGAFEPGTVLFWDEPEVGLNPKLMDELVKALILLARSGVQIFLTTHSYVILKELDLQVAEDDPIRYFLFEPTESSGTKVTPFETLAEVHPNPILEQYNDLYDREITRKTGRKKAQ